MNKKRAIFLLLAACGGMAQAAGIADAPINVRISGSVVNDTCTLDSAGFTAEGDTLPQDGNWSLSFQGCAAALLVHVSKLGLPGKSGANDARLSRQSGQTAQSEHLQDRTTGRQFPATRDTTGTPASSAAAPEPTVTLVYL